MHEKNLDRAPGLKLLFFRLDSNHPACQGCEKKDLEFSMCVGPTWTNLLY